MSEIETYTIEHKFDCGDIITVNLNVWHKFLEDHEDLMVSLWDLVPPNLTIIDIELVPFHEGGPLYTVEFKNQKFWLYEEDLILVGDE
jgi:hypothetical protein